MPHGTIDVLAPGLPIAAVERETGLAKDTLRVWERRYGFPAPQRDAAGDRRYPADQVARLRLIARLLAAGHRAGKVVRLDSAALAAAVDRLSPPPVAAATDAGGAADAATLEALMRTITAHDAPALRHALAHAQARMGLSAFVTGLVAPLAAEVGRAWAEGRVEVFEEHLYTEVMTGVLRHALSALAPPPAHGAPRVLLTTLPHELHALGLLMAEAMLALAGCACLSLGTQTPPRDVVRAAEAHRADVVALSFSGVHDGAAALASLSSLRSALPASVGLWVGGACDALYRAPLEGVTAVRELSGIAPLVAQWRREHR